MTATTYTFHSPMNHEIIATAEPATLQQIAAKIAETATAANNVTSRFYVHNGKGVIGAGVCKHSLWIDVERDQYRQFDQQARELRTAAGLAND